MQGTVKTAFGGFQKVVWENVADTLAGGVLLDLNGYTNADGIIPEGTLIGAKDATTGKSKIVSDAASLPAEGVIGFTVQTIAIDDNPWASVGICGAIRKDALIANYVTNVAALKTALPKITFVE